MNGLLRASLVALLAGFFTTGCLFNVTHELPPKSYFGELPDSDGAPRYSFAKSGHKNWALAGLVAYSSWGTDDLIPPSGKAHEHVEDLAIETTFDRFDTLIWVIPGFAYGYYLWAPRSISVEGNRVKDW